MRLGCIPWIIGLGLLIGGGQQLFTAVTNLKQEVLTIEQVEEQSPKKKWVKITGGTLDVKDYAYTSLFGAGSPSDVFIPLVSSDASSENSQITVLYHTSDKDILATVNTLAEFNDKIESGDPEAMQEVMEEVLKIQEKLTLQRDIEGIVKFGINSGKEENKIRSLYDNLAEDHIIIKAGEKPSLIQGILMLVGGIVVFVVMILITGARGSEG